MVYVKHKVAGRRQEFRDLAYKRDKARSRVVTLTKKLEHYQQLYDYYNEQILILEQHKI